MLLLRMGPPDGLRTPCEIQGPPPDVVGERDDVSVMAATLTAVPPWWDCYKIRPSEILVPPASDDPRADVTLLDRIARRDATAVAELYDQQSRLLFGLILRILKDRGEAEEVLQEVFVSVWTRAESYNVTLGSVVGWLVRIARNRAIDRLRSRNVRDRAVESYPAPVADDSPEAGAVRGEQQRTVARALNTLPADQRALIEDAYFLGLTHAELSERFQLPLGTVKTRIRAGMMALRQQLQEAVAGR